MTDLVATGIAPNRENMRAAASEGFATATDLADYLVRRGAPFRDAHEAVARAVRHAEAMGVDLSGLPVAELRQFSPLVGDDVHAVLTLEGSVASRDHPGGTAPAQVRAAVAAARKLLPPA
jgi:argininosuccinate lyase